MPGGPARVELTETRFAAGTLGLMAVLAARATWLAVRQARRPT